MKEGKLLREQKLSPGFTLRPVIGLDQDVYVTYIDKYRYSSGFDDLEPPLQDRLEPILFLFEIEYIEDCSVRTSAIYCPQGKFKILLNFPICIMLLYRHTVRLHTVAYTRLMFAITETHKRRVWTKKNVALI